MKSDKELLYNFDDSDGNIKNSNQDWPDCSIKLSKSSSDLPTSHLKSRNRPISQKISGGSGIVGGGGSVGGLSGSGNGGGNGGGPKTPKKSMSLTNIMGKSPARVPSAIGKSPVKHMSELISSWKSPSKRNSLLRQSETAKQPQHQQNTQCEQQSQSLSSHNQTTEVKHPPKWLGKSESGRVLRVNEEMIDAFGENKGKKETEEKTRDRKKKYKQHHRLSSIVQEEENLNQLRVSSDDVLNGHYDIFANVVKFSSEIEMKKRKSPTRTFKNTFLASDLFEWLINNRYASNKEEAIQIGQHFEHLQLVEHYDKHFVLTNKGNEIRAESGLSFFSLVFDSQNGVEIKDRNDIQSKKMKSVFVGSEFVDWFIQTETLSSRKSAVQIGKLFVERDLIEHIDREHHFKDGKYFYCLTRQGISMCLKIPSHSMQDRVNTDNPLSPSDCVLNTKDLHLNQKQTYIPRSQSDISDKDEISISMSVNDPQSPKYFSIYDPQYDKTAREILDGISLRLRPRSNQQTLKNSNNINDNKEQSGQQNDTTISTPQTLLSPSTNPEDNQLVKDEGNTQPISTSNKGRENHTRVGDSVTVNSHTTDETIDSYYLSVLDFCYDVSTFKVNYLCYSIPQRQEEANTIIHKFKSSPIVSFTDQDNIKEAEEAIQDSFKTDLFDKIYSDVSYRLHAMTTSGAPPSVTTTTTSSNINNPPTTPLNTLLKNYTSRTPKSQPLITASTLAPLSSQPPIETDLVDASLQVLQHNKTHQNTSNAGMDVLGDKDTVGVSSASKPKGGIRQRLSFGNKSESKSLLTTPNKKKAITFAETPENKNLWVRVTERDPRTNTVSGRTWKMYQYRLNQDQTKFQCYVSDSDMEINLLCIDLTKLTSSNDVSESEQLSEPENQRYAWAISPLRLLFACSTREERSAWMLFVKEKLYNIKSKPEEKNLTCDGKNNDTNLTQSENNKRISSSSSKKTIDPNLLPLLPSTDDSETNTQLPSIILRRYNKRGGVRVVLPQTMTQLLELASLKFNTSVALLREPETEAEISSIDLLRNNMTVWVMTDEEETKFFN